MADEIKGDTFRWFLETLAGLSMKLELEEKIMERKFKVGDIVVQTGTCNFYTVAKLLDDDCVEMMPNEHGFAIRFHESALELAPKIEVDHTNWGKSRISAINAAKGYMADSVTPKFDPDNVHAHLEVCGELNVTYEKKNADYGDSFAQSLDKHGLIAAIVRMDDKMNRVINLYKADEQLVEDESIRDTLMDLANYAIMSVMWLDTESANESDGGYISPTESKSVALLDSDSYLLSPGEAFRAGFGAGIIGSTDRDIYADNQKLDIDKALREGAHPQAIRDFLGGADYDGDTTNS